MTLDIDSIREIVRSEIPRALSEDPEVRRAIWLGARNEFADKRKTKAASTSPITLVLPNGVLILGAIKPSMSKGDMVICDRKTRWYEKQHNHQANCRIVISPMMDKRTERAARDLRIKLYSYAEDIVL
ncbi:MAG: hypothetical protein R6W76_15565 [Caldilinea sp.]